jgi:hypothetical protein
LFLTKSKQNQSVFALENLGAPKYNPFIYLGVPKLGWMESMRSSI